MICKTTYDDYQKIYCRKQEAKISFDMIWIDILIEQYCSLVLSTIF